MEKTVYCPRCSTAKSTQNTQFCTNCGLELSGLFVFFESGGSARRARRKGVEHGLKFLLAGLLLIPVWMFISAAFPAADRLVESSPSTTWAESVAWILMWMAFVAGASRIVFAIAFDSGARKEKSDEDVQRTFDAPQSHEALPSGDSFAAVNPGGWKISGELFEPVRRSSGDLGGR